jgi:hypothetical protein
MLPDRLQLADARACLLQLGWCMRSAMVLKGEALRHVACSLSRMTLLVLACLNSTRPPTVQDQVRRMGGIFHAT